MKTHQKKQMSLIFINESLIISAWVKKNHLVAIKLHNLNNAESFSVGNENTSEWVAF